MHCCCSFSLRYLLQPPRNAEPSQCLLSFIPVDCFEQALRAEIRLASGRQKEAAARARKEAACASEEEKTKKALEAELAALSNPLLTLSSPQEGEGRQALGAGATPGVSIKEADLPEGAAVEVRFEGGGGGG